MCTVSVIPIAGGYRVVHNRDERRDRVMGEPPAWRWFDVNGSRLEVLAPLDPAAGGTWLAMTRSGITAAVLNLNPPRGVRARYLGDGVDDGWLAAPPGFEGGKSRGVAILELLAGVASGRDAGEVCAEVFKGTRPCRSVLVVPDPEGGVVVISHPHAPEAFVHPPAGPAGQFALGADAPALCWVSSGLGDDVVEARMPLFDEMVRPAPSPESQDAFHRHQWAGRSEQSVLMCRSDARTVSITTVSVDGSGAMAGYESCPDQPAPG